MISFEIAKKETLQARRKRASQILARLKHAYPNAKIALNYSNNIQLLVAVIMSAQCTDKKINEITAALFRKYKTVDDFADADQKKFALEIKSAGFYNAKSKNIIAACKMIRKDFGGKLPKTMHEIMRLPGVARKTASIVLGNAYGVVEGITVDTHVRQFANYCALSFERDPVKIEQDLMKVIPKKEWFNATYRIIGFNREMRSRASREAAKLKIVLQDLCPASPI
ncbi:MAG: Endonuclease III [Parcubacteria group bacterium GW2011_GWA2_44_13]|nr:MAG: Endonuclease III [Parcubacteria group bacterium GW2011_GWA2_44_13]